MIFQLDKSREYSVWLLFYMTYFIFSSELSSSCTWSLRSLRRVSKCPTTKALKEKEEKIKNCEALAQKQNCTDPPNFKYHCVLNYDDNTFVEVCAPVVSIDSGYCAAFKSAEGKLVPHWKRKCDKTSESCPNKYKSSEFYLYVSCYDVYHNLSTDEKNYLLGNVLIASLVSSMCTCVTCILAFRYKKKISRYLKHSRRLSRLWRSQDSSEERQKDKTSSQLSEVFLDRVREKEEMALLRKEEQRIKKNKRLLKKPRLNTDLNVADVHNVNHIGFVSNEEMWLSDRKRVMNIDRQGKIIKCFAIDDIWGSSSHTVKKNGDLLLINDDRVQKISPDGIKSTIIAPEWTILSICTATLNGDVILGLYVLIEKGSRTKLARYDNKGNLRSEFEYYQNKRLYVSPLYLSVNTNMNICTADIDTCLVRAVDEFGKLLFTYDGQPKQVDFFPTGICNDSFGNILVCNRHKLNPSVHLLDMNGKLISIILSQDDGIKDPWGICVGTEGRIYLGQHDCSIIKVYDYLEDIVQGTEL